jgi:ATP-dependent RNA/DNA helicase IGHMBP2
LWILQGTGKTTAVTELVLQALIRGQRVLVCAPSNVAVDNILERLVAQKHKYRPADYCPSVSSSSSSAEVEVKVQAVRIGHPARMSSAVHRHCLDALVLHHEGTEIVKVTSSASSSRYYHDAHIHTPIYACGDDIFQPFTHV